MQYTYIYKYVCVYVCCKLSDGLAYSAMQSRHQRSKASYIVYLTPQSHKKQINKNYESPSVRK